MTYQIGKLTWVAFCAEKKKNDILLRMQMDIQHLLGLVRASTLHLKFGSLCPPTQINHVQPYLVKRTMAPIPNQLDIPGQSFKSKKVRDLHKINAWKIIPHLHSHKISVNSVTRRAAMSGIAGGGSTNCFLQKRPQQSLSCLYISLKAKIIFLSCLYFL